MAEKVIYGWFENGCLRTVELEDRIQRFNDENGVRKEITVSVDHYIEVAKSQGLKPVDPLDAERMETHGTTGMSQISQSSKRRSRASRMSLHRQTTGLSSAMRLHWLAILCLMTSRNSEHPGRLSGIGSMQ